MRGLLRHARMLPFALGASAVAHAGTPAGIASMPEFVYPEAERLAETGDVVCKVRFMVSAEGVPTRLDPLDCPEAFFSEVHARYEEARFEPATRDGEPVRAVVPLTVRFEMPSGTPPPPPEPVPELPTPWGAAPVAAAPVAAAPPPAVRRMPHFSYPDAARGVQPVDARCAVRFVFDVKGVPTELRNEDCADVFFAEVEEHYQDARFTPARRGGEAVPGEYPLTIRFILKGGAGPVSTPPLAVGAPGAPAPPPPAAAPPEVVREPPRKRSMPQFEYPPEARKAGVLESTCEVRWLVDEFGVPTDVQFGRCEEPFAAEVRAKAFAARFHPATEDGVPVASEFPLSISFRTGAGLRDPGGLVNGELTWVALRTPAFPVSPSIGPDPWGIGAEAGFRTRSKLVVGVRLEHQAWPDWDEDGSLSRTQGHAFFGFDMPARRTQGWTWSGGLMPTVGAGVGHQVERQLPSVRSATFGTVDAGVSAWVGRRISGRSFVRLSVGARYDGVPERVRDARIGRAHAFVGVGVGAAP